MSALYYQHRAYLALEDARKINAPPVPYGYVIAMAALITELLANATTVKPTRPARKKKKRT